MNIDSLKAYLKKNIYIICLILVFFGLLYDRMTKKVSIVDRYIENGNIMIVLDGQGLCHIGNDINDGNWFETDEKNICTVPLVPKGNIYVKNQYSYLSQVLEDQKFSYIESIKIVPGNVYLAINGKQKVSYETSIVGVVDEPVIFNIKDTQIATVDSDGIVTGLSKGTTTLSVNYGDKQDSVEVIVSDLISTMAPVFDMKKPFLTCGVFSKEDNNLLDAILFSRVDNAGYKTRAGAVAAGRFLAMEFPYRINYFTENGRLGSCSGRKVDGEGRYYHRGLYLDPSRYDVIDLNYTMAGPAPWGCTIREYSWDRNAANGLDCSGSITWILVQAGYDPGDIGAGITPACKAMSDLGERYWLADAYDKKTLKVGDLLSGGEDGPEGGGHIAMCVGIDKDGYVYVAEELGYHDYWGFMIRKYNRNELLHYFYWQVDMDEFYGAQGNLTNYWIDE